mgnify:FL=1
MLHKVYGALIFFCFCLRSRVPALKACRYGDRVELSTAEDQERIGLFFFLIFCSGNCPELYVLSLINHA